MHTPENGMTMEWVKGKIKFIGVPHQLITNDGVLMQFTGLTDKNGVEIFEGDILKFFASDKSVAQINPNRWLFEVLFEGAAFGYKGLKNGQHVPEDELFKPFFQDDELQDCGDIEVIGNVFQNPELLK